MVDVRFLEGPGAGQRDLKPDTLRAFCLRHARWHARCARYMAGDQARLHLQAALWWREQARRGGRRD